MMNTNISFLSWAFCNTNDDLSEVVPNSLLRGIGSFGKLILSAFWKLKINQEFFLVLSTQYGNVQQLVKMGRQILYENFSSPLLFSKVSSNVPAGVISMLTKSHEKYTTVSGGVRSFEMGLLESLLSSHDDVVYIYAEDSMTGFVTDDNSPSSGAFALHIKKDVNGNFGLKNNIKSFVRPRSRQSFVDFLNNKDKEFEAAHFLIERREING